MTARKTHLSERRIPKRLGNPPIVEAIFEVRFAASTPSPGDLLPGLLFPHFESEISESSSLPFADIPRPLRQAREEFKYRAMHAMAGPKYRILVGDQIVTLNHSHPYEGWESFRAVIIRLLEALASSRLVPALERYSIKTVNILPAEPGNQLGLLDVEIKLAGKPAPETGFQLRAELNDPQFTRIVEIKPNASMQSRTTSQLFREGVYISVDCIKKANKDMSWGDIVPELDTLHEELKGVFFSLLTERTLETLKPEYEVD